ncbi:MAG: WD40 repeat domain-containing protein [Methylotenera sp.]|nr:WD40 repeat domain-containing protein [Methylotenera sp.]
MFRHLGFGLLIALLIYGWSVDAQLSVSEKIGIAFPPPPEVAIARQNLESLAQATKTSLVEFNKANSEKLKYRSLNCLINMSADRFDSISKIKKLPINAHCLATMDKELQQLVEMQQVAIRLSQPPLRPQIQLGQKTDIHQPIDWMTATATFASKSGVAVLSSERGFTEGSALISYDIKENHTIAKLELIRGADVNKISLSPNGRVATVTAGKGFGGKEVIFLDTETGNILCRLEEMIGVQTWLPEISAAILKHNVNSTISIADFNTGKITPYQLDSEVQRWAVSLSDSPSHMLVGGDKGFYIVKNTRKKNTIESAILKSFDPKSQQYNAYDSPLSMMGGKAVIFTRDNFLVQYDLGDGKETRIETYPFLDNNFKKLDEERLLAKVRNSDELKVFNITDQTLSSINDATSKTGSISELVGRNGFMRKEYDQFWIGEELALGEPVALKTLFAEMQAEATLKQMEEKIKDQKEIGIFGIPIFDEPQPKLEMPMAVASGTESTSKAEIQKHTSSSVPLIKSTYFGIPLMPANVKVEFIGVNDAANTVSHEIPVMVEKSERPIILILSSCHTVNWKLTKKTGSRLLAIFQQISYVGQPFSSIQINNSDYSTSQMMRLSGCVIKKDTPEYRALNQEAIGWAGKSIEKFQSANAGIVFSVGN